MPMEFDARAREALRFRTLGLHDDLLDVGCFPLQRDVRVACVLRALGAASDANPDDGRVLRYIGFALTDAALHVAAWRFES